MWDDHPDFLIWLIYIGGSFAPIGSTRSDYIVLLRHNFAARFAEWYDSWPALHEILKQFIWSEKVFNSQVKAFWEESSM